MQIAANVEFPGLSQPVQRLSLRDKSGLFSWGHAVAPPGIGGAVLYEGVDIARREVDFVLVLGADRRQARWGLAREGHRIRLWRCSDGCELGSFGTMQHALAGLARYISTAGEEGQGEKAAPARFIPA